MCSARNLPTETAVHFLRAGHALETWYAVCAIASRGMTVEQQQVLLDAVIEHNTHYLAAGGHLVPKHHYWMHLAWDIVKTGNPRLFHCYQDESMNGRISQISASCHKLTFVRSVFRKVALQNR